MATTYYDIQINDSTLNESGFTKFSLPINGKDNNKNDLMSVWNNEDKRKITYCHFHRSDLEKTVKSLEEKLVSEQLVDKNTIENLVTLFRNECVILKEDKNSGFFNSNSNGKAAKKSKSDKSAVDDADNKQKPKSKYTAYKYSKKGKLSLHEAVILAGRPVFLTVNDGNGNDFQQYDIIEEHIRVIEPPHVENYPYEPYEFENMDEVLKYRNRALSENIDSLYLQARQIAHNYNDQNKDKISLLAIEIIASYFQDRFPTTHYDIVLGGNGSGKSSYGDTFTAVGYRVVNLTDPNAANINRILGPIEIGQCTIVSDETGAIDKHPDLMSILKTGY
jgi:hypothetical protein